MKRAPLPKRLQEADEEVKQRMDSVSYQLQQVEIKLDYIENQGRCCNLRFDAVPEIAKEDWEGTECKVVNLITWSWAYLNLESAEHTATGSPHGKILKL